MSKITVKDKTAVGTEVKIDEIIKVDTTFLALSLPEMKEHLVNYIGYSQAPNVEQTPLGDLLRGITAEYLRGLADITSQANDETRLRLKELAEQIGSSSLFQNTY